MDIALFVLLASIGLDNESEYPLLGEDERTIEHSREYEQNIFILLGYDLIPCLG